MKRLDLSKRVRRKSFLPLVFKNLLLSVRRTVFKRVSNIDSFVLEDTSMAEKHAPQPHEQNGGSVGAGTSEQYDLPTPLLGTEGEGNSALGLDLQGIRAEHRETSPPDTALVQHPGLTHDWGAPVGHAVQPRGDGPLSPISEEPMVDGEHWEQRPPLDFSHAAQLRFSIFRV